MSNVEVLLPNLNPLRGSAATCVKQREGFPPKLRPPFRRAAPRESESDSPHPKKMKTRRRWKKTKLKVPHSGGILRVCKTFAPFNSNQFLMEENDNLNLDAVNSPTRRRFDPPTGSHSCSPYNSDNCLQWEEFSKQEFLGAYQDVTVQRLDSLSKAQLVEEYLGLEDELTALKSRLDDLTSSERLRGMIEVDPDGSDLRPGEVMLTGETAAKISVFKEEISALELENKELREKNDSLLNCGSSNSSDSSSSSSSSGSSSSGWSSSDSSSSDDDTSRPNDDTKTDSVSASVNMTCEVINCAPANVSPTSPAGSSEGAAATNTANVSPTSPAGSSEGAAATDTANVSCRHVSEDVPTVDGKEGVKPLENDASDNMRDSGLDNDELGSDSNCENL